MLHDDVNFFSLLIVIFNIHFISLHYIWMLEIFYFKKIMFNVINCLFVKYFHILYSIICSLFYFSASICNTYASFTNRFFIEFKIFRKIIDYMYTILLFFRGYDNLYVLLIFFSLDLKCQSYWLKFFINWFFHALFK